MIDLCFAAKWHCILCIINLFDIQENEDTRSRVTFCVFPCRIETSLNFNLFSRNFSAFHGLFTLPAIWRNPTDFSAWCIIHISFKFYKVAHEIWARKGRCGPSYRNYKCWIFTHAMYPRVLCYSEHQREDHLLPIGGGLKKNLEKRSCSDSHSMMCGALFLAAQPVATLPFHIIVCSLFLSRCAYGLTMRHLIDRPEVSI